MQMGEWSMSGECIESMRRGDWRDVLMAAENGMLMTA